MHLDLTDEEANELRLLLDNHLGDMSAEISHTDNPSFRAHLRDERALLRSVRDKLVPA